MKIGKDKKAGNQKQFSLICIGIALVLVCVSAAVADTYNEAYPDDCDAEKLRLLPEFADQSIGSHPQNCTASNLKLPAWSNPRGWNNDAYELTIDLVNVAGDSRLELVGRDPVGVNVQGFELDPDMRWWGAWLPRYSAETRKVDLADPIWMSPAHYSSIRFLDLDGDGTDEMVAYDAGDNGLGLVAYRFIGGDDQAAGNWEPINESGFILPTHTDWTRPEYYQTFRVGIINPGTDEQLFVRSMEGVIGLQWDDAISNFVGIDGIANRGPFADADGWDKKMYYSSLNLVDLDGDGFDELVGRGSTGLYGYKFEPESGWTRFATPAGLVSDSKVGKKNYYQTMTWGNFRDSAKASLAIWNPQGRSKDGPYGVILIEWDADKNVWSTGIMSKELYPWDSLFRGFSSSFRAADIDGDGLDELHFLDWQAGGLRSYKFSTSGHDSEWQLVNTGNNEDESILINDGRTIHFGDITGNGVAEVIGRTAAGLETYFYDSESQRWEENYSCGFPDFTGQKANAYAAMNQLRFAGATEFRHQYNDSSANASNLNFLLRNGQRPGGPTDSNTAFTQTDWEAVRCQLLRENDWANSVLGVFADQYKTFDGKYTSEWESTDTVGAELIESIRAKKGIEIEVIFEGLMLGGIDLATVGIATLAFKSDTARDAAKGLLSGMGDLVGSVAASAAIEDIFPADLTVGSIARIKDLLHDKKQDALTELGSSAGDISGYYLNQEDNKAGDLGSMAAVGLLHRRAYWPANFSKNALVQDRSRWSFKRWLYQQILTTVYEVHIFDCGYLDPGCHRNPSPSRTRICYDTKKRKVIKYPNNFGEWVCNTGNTVYFPKQYVWIYLAIEQKGWSKSLTLPEDVLATLTQKVSGECAQAGKYYVSKCSLGLDVNDLLQRRNGWNFTVNNTSSYADDYGRIVYSKSLKSKSLSCAGLAATIVGTEGDDVIIGTSGPDIISTVGGNDVIYAGGGDDIICSGDGNDRVYGGAGDDRIILGSGNDYGIGGAGDDWISSESGQNSLYGGQGDDVLEGGYEELPD